MSKPTQLRSEPMSAESFNERVRRVLLDKETPQEQVARKAATPRGNGFQSRPGAPRRPVAE